MHSDAVLEPSPTKAQEARELLALLETIPPVPVDDIVKDALMDLVNYIVDRPDGFRVAGTNSPDALIRCWEAFKEDRGFEVSNDPLDAGDGSTTSWTEVLGHSQ
jgi:hypothetical protein